MAILNFVKPDKVILLQSTPSYGEFEFRPLERGYGLTVGNAIRRVLLSSLQGFAIVSVKIEGIEHEFSTIKGIVEDVTEIILNLKKLRFKQQVADADTEDVSISFSGKKLLTAGDLQKFTSNFQILNPDQPICQMNKGTSLNMQFSISKGRGYVTAEENKTEEAPLGTIFTDSIFTPIRNVKYRVENYRVEQKTDYEKLVLDIQTDGSINPKEALTDAANTLIQHFTLFSEETITAESDQTEDREGYDEESLHMRQLLKTKLIDLDLSVRALNCLKAVEVETLADLISYSRSDLLKVRNFGKKTLTELLNLVSNKGLTFGMDLTRYKLDRD